MKALTHRKPMLSMIYWRVLLKGTQTVTAETLLLNSTSNPELRSRPDRSLDIRFCRYLRRSSRPKRFTFVQTASEFRANFIAVIVAVLRSSHHLQCPERLQLELASVLGRRGQRWEGCERVSLWKQAARHRQG